MNKSLEFKIKVNKHFDVDSEKEVIKYYVKKKTFFGWWYLINEKEDLFPAFMVSTMVDTIIVGITAYFLKYTFDIDVVTYQFFIISMLSLSGFWYLMSFKIYKKDFGSREDALSHIKNLIRKSKLEKYHTTEDILITYKEGKLEVEK